MGEKTKIDNLLSDIRELEQLLDGVRDAEIYPVSFFSKAFDFLHKSLNDLHGLENDQVEMLRKQMEAHKALLDAQRAEENAENTVYEEPKKEQTEVFESISVAPSVAEEKHSVSLHDVLEKQNLADFRRAFNLNDRFYFRKELFNGDEAKMNKVLSDLNDIHSYGESLAYLNKKLNWNIEDTTVAEFIKLLEKRFL